MYRPRGSSDHLRTLSRTVGPPSSNICSFQSESLPGVSFSAFGLSDGTLIVLRAKHDEATCSPDQEYVASHGQFVPALLIDQLQREGDSEEGDGAFVTVAWGGGACHLLGAATKHHLHIFSLRNFFLSELLAEQPKPPSSPPSAAPSSSLWQRGLTCVPLPGSNAHLYHCVSRSRLHHPVLAMDWTHGGCGLLLADESNRVVMMSVLVSGLGSQHVARGGYPDVQVSEAWSIHSDAPHVLAAAGLDTLHPCATAAKASEKTSSQHRVTIWWPQPQQQQPQKQANATGGKPAMSGKSADRVALSGSAPGSAASATQPHPPPPSSSSTTNAAAAPCSVGAEVIRHPVKVLSMQWSPALASSSPPPATSPPPAQSTLASRPVSGMSSDQKQKQPSSPTVIPTPPEPHAPSLALMTVGADWSVRIYVEVVMHDLFPGGGAGGTPGGMSMSQYCLTLVIEPPVQGLSPGGLMPGLRACWAKPLPHLEDLSAGIQKSGRGGTIRGGSVGVVRSGAGGQPEEDEEALMSSKVHWVVASISVPGEQPGELEEQLCVWAIDSLSGVILSGLPRGASSSSKASAPKAILWGRCGNGLGGGETGSRLRSTAPVSRSPAIRWPGADMGGARPRPGSPSPAAAPRDNGAATNKQHLAASGSFSSAPEMSWINPSGLVSTSGSPSSPVGCRATLGITSYVAFPEGVPVIHTIDHYRSEGCPGAEIRSVELATITHDNSSTGSWDPPTTGILVTRVCHQLLSGASHRPLSGGGSDYQSAGHHGMGREGGEGIGFFEVHAQLGVGLTLDRGGRLGLWCLSPVEQIPLVESRKRQQSPPKEGGQPHAPSLSDPISAVTWLPTPTVGRNRRDRDPTHNPHRPRSLSPISTGATQRSAHILAAFVDIASPICVFQVHLPGSASLADRKLMGSEELHQPWQAIASGVVVLQIDPASPEGPLRVHKLLCSASRQSNDGSGALLVSAFLGPRPKPSAEDGSEGVQVEDGQGGSSRWLQWRIGLDRLAGFERCHDQPRKDLGPEVSCLERGGPEEGSESRPGSAAFLAGTRRGSLQLWSLDHLFVGAGSVGSKDGRAGSIQPALLQEYQCTPSASGPSTDAVSDEAAEGLGTISAVARHAPSGFIAAAVSRGQRWGSGPLVGDKVCLWRPTAKLRERDDDEAPPEGEGAAASGPEDGNRPRGPKLDWTLELDEVLELEAPLEDMAWMMGTGVVPVLALALESGLVSVYIRDRCTSLWSRVAAHQTGPPSCAGLHRSPLSIAGLSNGTLAVATGCHITVLSNLLEPSPGCGQASSTSSAPSTGAAAVASSLPDLAQMLSGSFPAHHPLALAALVAKGRLAEVCKRLRGLIKWLQDQEKRIQDGIVDDSAEDQGGASVESGVAPLSAERSRCVTAAAAAAAARKQLAAPWSMIESLAAAGGEGGLESSRGGLSGLLQMMAQQRHAPPPPPPSSTSSAPSSSSSSTAAFPGGSVMGGRPRTVQQDKPLPSRPLGSTSNDDAGMPMKPLSSLFSPPAPSADSTEPTARLAKGSLLVGGMHSGQSNWTTAPSSRPAASQSTMDTGMLDMSAFGFGATSVDSVVSDMIPTPPPSRRPPAPAAVDPMSSGMLDMSAFGFGSWPTDDDDEARRLPPPPLPPTAPPSAPPPPSNLESGMIDMSAFGFGEPHVEEEEDDDASISLPPRTSLNPTQTQTGLLGMFGFGGTPGSKSLHPNAALQAAVPSPSSAMPSMLSSHEPAQIDGEGDPPSVLAEGSRSSAPKPGPPPSTIPPSPSSKVLFTRGLSEAISDSTLPGLMLDQREVEELERLLDVQQVASEGGKSPESEALPSSLLPSYLREDPRKAAEDLARQLMELSGLDRELAGKLAVLARALAKSEGQDDVRSHPVSKLDTPAMTFLVSCQIAAGLERRSRAGPRDGVKADGGDASHLFRGTTVTRMDPSSSLGSAGSLAPSGGSLGAAPSLSNLPTAAAEPQEQRQLGASEALGSLRPRSRSGALGGGSAAHPSQRHRGTGSIRALLSLPHEAVGYVQAVPSPTPSSLRDTLRLLPGLNMRSLLWALASGCQGALLEAAVMHVEPRPEDDAERVSPDVTGFKSVAQSAAAAGQRSKGTLSWPQMRRAGAGLWLLDKPQARAQAEALARAQFARYRDPYECMLVYLALGKKAVLQTLFRQASNLKIADFLQRDFRSEDNRNAAAKNAFALLGQHRHELAASFFILAGQHWDAVGVLAHEQRDPQLALLVARLLEDGPGPGPHTQRLVDQDLLPLARLCGDVCSEAALLWAAGRPQDGVLTLIRGRGAGGEEGGGGPPRWDDPFALDLVLTCGLQQLSGRYVPSTLPNDVARMALAAADALNAAGMPSLALEALLVTRKILSTLSSNTAACSTVSAPRTAAEGVSPDDDDDDDAFFGPMCDRLLSSCWAAFAAASSAVDPSESSSPSTSAGWCLAVEQQLAALSAAGVPLSAPDIMSVLRRHAECSALADGQPLLPPLKLRKQGDASRPSASWPQTLSPTGSATHAIGSPGSRGASGGLQLLPRVGHPGCHKLSPRSSMERSPPGRSSGGGAALSRLPTPETLPVGAAAVSRSSSSGSSHQHPSVAHHHHHHHHVGDGGGGGSPTLPLFEDALEVISVEGDKCRRAASSGLVTPDGHGRPIAVVTGHSGLLWGGLAAPRGSSRQQQPSHRQSPSSMFLGLMQQVLDHVRWTPDPWAVMANDSIRENTGPSASASHTHAAAVAAHPERDMFLSGSSSDHVFLWKHGETSSRATYLPMLACNAHASHASRPINRELSMPDLMLAPHWNTAVALHYSRTGSHFAGLGEGGLVALWRQDSVGAGGVGYADWTHHRVLHTLAQCLHKRGYDIALLSDEGSQLVACGRGERGGTLCWWDTLSPPGSGLVAEIRGRKADPTALTVVHAPAGPLLVFGDEAGDLTALDLRMLSSRAPLWTLPRVHHGSAVTSLSCWASGTATAPTTRIKLAAPDSLQKTPGATAGSSGGGAAAAAVPLQQLLVSGAKDGGVFVVDVQSGKVVDVMDKVHYTASKNPLVLLTKAFEGMSGATAANQTRRSSAGGGRPSGITGVPISSVVCLQDGVMTSGIDGAVRFHMLSSDRLA